MRKKEFRSCGVFHPNVVEQFATKLKTAGIDDSYYRVNYFSISAEIVAEKSMVSKVKAILG